MPPEFIHAIAEKLNKNINLPWLDEAQEHLIIEAVLQIALLMLPGYLEKNGKFLPVK